MKGWDGKLYLALNELFPCVENSTDSETLFFSRADFRTTRRSSGGAGADDVGCVERARKDAGIEQPIYFSACTTDGKRLWAVRYSSNNVSRTQYHSCNIHAFSCLDARSGTSLNFDDIRTKVGINLSVMCSCCIHVLD